MAKTLAAKSPSSPAKRTFDALPDTIDFRDATFVPTLIYVPPASDLDGYRSHHVPVLDQGREGACTGFGLATVANYLIRVRGGNPLADEVSAWMLYTMAKRYDEWPGEDYDGSSARGAMKGWFKHGLCARALWDQLHPDPTLEEKRSADAIARPLGAYFRVNHKDLVAMHSAINEVGALYATATVHEGWQQVAKGDEDIAYREGAVGGHAFAIIGYDRKGFWIQNSWGEDWGAGGLARLSYADWLANGTDVWVAALGAPVDLGVGGGVASMRAGAPYSYEAQVYADLRPHIITSKNDGVLDDKGMYGLTPGALETMLTRDMTAKMANWNKKRVLLYAHGGLVGEAGAVQTVARNVGPLMAGEVYPLSFIWRSDAWSTIKDILKDAIGRRSDEGLLDKTKDFMWDRIDDTLEVAARALGGKALWSEMKENAERASSQAQGSAKLAADHLIALHKAGAIDEIHLVGHSAGSIFHAGVAGRLSDAKVPIRSLSLWAPACTLEVFDTIYRPLIEAGKIEQFDLFTMDDATEQDDNCGDIYHKSLLYLVSHAFERKPRIPMIQNGTPILGLARDAGTIDGKFWKDGGKDRRWYVAPGKESGAMSHGGFDDDPATLLTTLARIRGTATTQAIRKAGKPPARSLDARRNARQKLGIALRR